ncbi:MAG TPA: hypothetical protein VIY49_12075 [Bryobacteraceae bacterium]
MSTLIWAAILLSRLVGFAFYGLRLLAVRMRRKGVALRPPEMPRSANDEPPSSSPKDLPNQPAPRTRNQGPVRRKNAPPRPLLTRNWLLNRCAMVAAAIPLTGLTADPARQLQDWYEHSRQWTQARAVGSATAFRTYLQQRPNGRYAGPAEQRPQQVYADASQRFNESVVVDGSDRLARDAVLEMLQEAARTGGYKVGVYFERQNQVPADIEESIQRRSGVSRVSPIGDASSDANMRAPEESIVMHVQDAFGKLIPGDVLAFKMSREKLPPLWLMVNVPGACRQLNILQYEGRAPKRGRQIILSRRVFRLADSALSG